ncbi:MAG: hypothetical protein IKS07_09470, partial [Lachnospiraceae bacterium]|nr:hypothetical protein [Lachnospiraceae bacterium]
MPPKTTKEEMLNGKKKSLQGIRSRMASLDGIYGVSGQLPPTVNPDAQNEYNQIRLPVPEGLSPHMVTMIALGCAMDPSRLDRELTSSSVGGSSMAAFNQDFLVENIAAGDDRSAKFYAPLLESRRAAKEALEKYASGDTEEVKRHLRTLIQAALNGVSFITFFDKPNSLTRAPLEMAYELVQQNFLGLGDELNEMDKRNLSAAIKQIEATNAALEMEVKELENPSPAGSPQRESFALELLLRVGTGRVNDLRSVATYDRSVQRYETLAEKYGFMRDPQTGKRTQELKNLEDRQKGGVDVGVFTLGIFDSMTVLPDETQFLLGGEQGGAELRALYEEAIKGSELYKKLVEAKDAEELKQAIEEADRANLTKYPSVQVPTQEADRLIREDERYRAPLQQIDAYLLETEGAFRTYTAKQFEDMLNSIPSKRWGRSDSPELKEVKDSLRAYVDLLRDPQQKSPLDRGVIRASMTRITDATDAYRRKVAAEHGGDVADPDFVPRRNAETYEQIGVIEQQVRRLSLATQPERQKLKEKMQPFLEADGHDLTEAVQTLNRLFGSHSVQSEKNAHKAEMDALVIAPPEDMGDFGETFVTLVTLGASMNPAYMTEKSESTQGGADEVYFNQTNLVSNYPIDDHRFITEGFTAGILKGRQDAAQAIEEYKRGNYGPVKEALGRVLHVMGTGAADISLAELKHFGTTNVAGVKLLSELMGKERDLPFLVSETVPRQDEIKSKAQAGVYRAYEDKTDAVKRIMQAPGAPGSPEREELLSRIMVDMYVESTIKAAQRRYLRKESEALWEKLLAER